MLLPRECCSPVLCCEDILFLRVANYIAKFLLLFHLNLDFSSEFRLCLGTARCGEGSGGGGAVRLREERERREPPAGAGWSGAGGGAGLGAVLCAELREAEGKYGLGHKEDAVQPCLAARSAARCAGRGAKERPDGGGAPRRWRCGTRGARSACVGCGLSVYGYGCVIGANWSPACSGTQLREHPASL